MLDWCNTTPGSKPLVDEMLHSIFFLGKINKVPYDPESIIADKEMLEDLQEKYPRPFKFFLTQLPKRSPFSCVMDMIVKQKGEKNDNQIKESLKDLLKDLEEGFLVSSTICVSQKSQNVESVRYYGVSMSTTGPNAGNIVIAASCLSAWEDYVADAVITYYPEKGKKDKIKKEYFDGTIEVPGEVICKAFNLSKGDEIPPCRSCGNLFGLATNVKKEWVYGHCAEVESLSNMLKNEAEVRRDTKQESATCTPQNRKTAKDSVLVKLNSVLSTIQFKTWEDQQFYDPLVE
ncbi:uncharacterized protein LOC130184088 [Seriola aureovittata]|uniref:uncharacterized protein LOC130184088 n=1 Tax=Seriola aureovittata TaxID=2871759 RepID=UPI0024BEFDAB|nr:uncharacterized protein LOC130184088 [Seriola aureovittata]